MPEQSPKIGLFIDKRPQKKNDLKCKDNIKNEDDKKKTTYQLFVRMGGTPFAF